METVPCKVLVITKDFSILGDDINIWQCNPNPCLHGGTCTALKHGYALYMCVCAPGFAGGRCSG